MPLIEGTGLDRETEAEKVPLAAAATADAADRHVEEPEVASTEATGVETGETPEEEINLMQPPARTKKAKKAKNEGRGEGQQLSDFSNEVRRTHV